jgi:hypothetical protein
MQGRTLVDRLVEVEVFRGGQGLQQKWDGHQLR